MGFADLNVQAFLRVIRYCEGTSGPNGYRMMFGGELVNDLKDHPRKLNTFKLKKGGQISSTAAGAYQFLVKTWDTLRVRHGYQDFGVENQDKAAVELIKGRGALGDVRAGRFETAILKCNREWASLPGSPYGQPTKTMQECKKIYEESGGQYEPNNRSPFANPNLDH